MPFSSNRRKRHYRPSSILSKNDLLVKSRSALWLLRVIEAGVPYSDEFFEFVEWLAEDDLETLIADVKQGFEAARLPRLTQKQRDAAMEGFEHAEEGEVAKGELLGSISKVAPQVVEKCVKEGLCPKLKVMHASYARRSKGNMLETGKGNMRRILGLSDAEAELCMLLHIVDQWEALEAFFYDYLKCANQAGAKTLATIVGVSTTELRRLLNGKLQDLAIVDLGSYTSLSSDYECFFEYPDPKRLTARYFKTMRGAPLPLDHFIIDDSELKLIQAVLQAQTDSPRHILLYGSPGTGKTSFSHSLASELGQDAIKIAVGKDNASETRRAGIEACLHMTNQGTEALIVVDEADMLLNTSFSYLFSGEKSDKGWLNELLEKPGTRMVWITNAIGGIEDSVLRRFAYSMNFKPLNLRQRKVLWDKILRKHRVKSLVPNFEISDMAMRHQLSAGSIDLAVRNARDVSGRDANMFRKTLELTLTASTSLLDGGRKTRRTHAVEKEFSLEGLNVSGDLDELIKQAEMFDNFLREGDDERRVNMNLLFYGPPGTGKTELTRYVAHHLKRKLMVKRTSDILGPYVGMTEQNIAEAFRQAEEQEAILVIDEIDSLLFSRDMAKRTWETSQVNEFLTQMEDFRGLLICTTNRLDQMDQASLRRFNHKVNFDYLTPQGNRIFYKKMLQPLTENELGVDHLYRLETMNNLTPGDFKVVRDRFAFYSRDNLGHEELMIALQGEAALKKMNNSQRIGF